MPGINDAGLQKRVLTESTKAVHNGVIKSPPMAKKRKFNGNVPRGGFHSSQSDPNGIRSKLGSSQPKSQFETEVLEKMTQDISELKHSNSEKDQQWERPRLNDFDETKDKLCFQQIEVTEGTLHGGKNALKLFGVTEVEGLRKHLFRIADYLC